MIEFTLPFPPSVNRIWRNVGNKTLLSEEGRTYRKHSILSILEQGVPCRRIAGSLYVSLTVFPPDRRRRDLDNLCKAALDSIKHAGIIEDDSFIDRLEITRGEQCDGGELLVEICNWGEKSERP